MYKRAEISQVRQAFWTTFGQYMAPLQSAEGERINWVNYKTGKKGVFFKMEAGIHSAYIGIELHHTDTGMQQLYFEQFEQLMPLLYQHLNEGWNWQQQAQTETGQTISRIFTEQPGVNIMNRNNWPGLISFFKPRLMALDAFWSEVKYAFEAIR